MATLEIVDSNYYPCCWSCCNDSLSTKLHKRICVTCKQPHVFSPVTHFSNRSMCQSLPFVSLQTPQRCSPLNNQKEPKPIPFNVCAIQELNFRSLFGETLSLWFTAHKTYNWKSCSFSHVISKIVCTFVLCTNLIGIWTHLRTKLRSIRNGHGQIGWFPFGYEGLYFYV